MVHVHPCQASGRLARLVVVALCVEAGDACARVPPATGSFDRASELAIATVVVRNHHAADLRVYVIAADGTSSRLGLAPRYGAATFVLPRRIRLPAAVQFVAIPLGSDEPQVTGPAEVEVGTHLVFTVENAASISTLVRRP